MTGEMVFPRLLRCAVAVSMPGCALFVAGRMDFPGPIIPFYELE